MSTADKAGFLNDTEKRLSEILTAGDMNRTLTALSEILADYELVRTTAERDGSDDLLKTYIDTLRIQGRSERTVKRYEYVISTMLKKVSISTRRITVYHLRNYLAGEKERGIADSSLESIRQIFSAYFNWLQREGLIEKNPTANLGAIKIPKKRKAVYSPVDIEKLNSMCKTIRDKAIIAFLKTTGCRISEMTGLDRDSINFRTMECTVLGKGNKERLVYLDPVACMMIQDYLKTRKDDNPALFIGLRNERLQPDGVRTMLKELAKRAGVENVHPHKFRRTLATNLIRHGMPIQEVASILGHDKLDTTLRYVVQSNEDIQHSFRRYYA